MGRIFVNSKKKIFKKSKKFKISKKYKKYYCTGGSNNNDNSNEELVKHGDICRNENRNRNKNIGLVKMGQTNNKKIVPLICKKSLRHLTKKYKKRKSTLSSNKQKSCYNKYCWHKLSAKNKLFKRNKYKEVLKEIKKSKKKNINQKLSTKPPKSPPKPPPKLTPKPPPPPPRSNSNQMPKNNKTNSKKDSSFKLISWNVYFKLLSTNPMRLDNIKMYLSEPDIKPDILFTQESHFDLPEPTFSNYKHIFFSSPRKSAISIHFNNDKFNLNSEIVKLGLSDKGAVFNKKIKEIEFKVDDNINDNTGSSYRPILAVKLEHKESKKNIIFVNIWAPHHINKKRTGNMAIFFSSLNKVIDSLYENGDRIIMAGDFNEFYENSSNAFNVNTIDLKCGIRLHLKQKENTCCGSTTISKTGGLFRGIEESRPFDLLYDSDVNGSEVKVGDNRMSDHLPILSTIKI